MFFVDLDGRDGRPAVAEAVEGLRAHAEVRARARLVPGGLSAAAYRYTPPSRWRPPYPQAHWGPCRSATTSGTDLNPTARGRWSGGRVLVLNATYEPINVCTVRRATVLLLKEKAEVIELGSHDAALGDAARSPRPVVIRLVTYVRSRATRTSARSPAAPCSPATAGRASTAARARRLTVDHVIPRSKGGGSGWDNIVASCAPCNRRKGDRLPHQVDMHPRVKPRIAEPAHLHPARVADDPGDLAAVPAARSRLTSPAAGRAALGPRPHEGRPVDTGRPSLLTSLDLLVAGPRTV